MFRAILVLLVLPALTTAAPPPKGAAKKTELFWPTTAGTTWVLDVTTANGPTSMTMTVTSAGEKNGVFRVTTEEDCPAARPVREVTYEVSANGVSVLARGGRELPTPQPLFKLPAKSGDTWQHPAQLGWSGASCTVGEAAEVETPAGKFRATPVESWGTGHDSTTVTTTWWSPGIGVVKTVIKIDDRERSTRLLKSFTPAAGGNEGQPKK